MDCPNCNDTAMIPDAFARKARPTAQLYICPTCGYSERR